MRSIYLSEVLSQIPQILSNQDRDPLSPSYGSFDRKYWGWKYKDFSDATLQCALSPLIQVWDLDAPENPYYRNEWLLQWITAGVDFLFKIQHQNGGFDQCYPYECAPGNSYELFEPVAQFLEKAAGEISEDRLAAYRTALKKSCEFTLTRDEDHGLIANHFALYAYISLRMGRFFGNGRFMKKGWVLLDKTLSLQSAEGWFQEYDGADPGYETRTLYYLSKIAREFSREDLYAPLAKNLKNFLIYCIHPDGSLGGEYGSRNTSLCYPAGFEVLSTRIPEAAAMARAVRRGLETGRVLSLGSVDPDNLVRMAANYLEAHHHATTAAEASFALPFERDSLEHSLPAAGLHVKATPSYYFLLNAKKGGGFRLYDKKTGSLIFNDTSYGALTRDGSVITANLLAPSPEARLGSGRIDIETRFHDVLQQNVTPLKMIALRVASLTFLRIGFVSRLFSRFVARVLFTGRKRFPYVLRRRFDLNEDSVRVTDTIEDVEGLKTIFATSFSTSIHMASSKYFWLGDLPALSRPRGMIELAPEQKKEFSLKTEIQFKNGAWRVEQKELTEALQTSRQSAPATCTEGA